MHSPHARSQGMAKLNPQQKAMPLTVYQGNIIKILRAQWTQSVLVSEPNGYC